MIAIIKYSGGNVRSVLNAIARLGLKGNVTSDASEILQADKVIFPGQGRAKPAMEDLNKQKLDEVIKKIEAPFLGICLGMQLLLPFSEEDDTKCLGVIPGKVKRFPNQDTEGNKLNVPLIGWNNVKQKKDDPLFKDVPDNSYFYFVNSYYADPESAAILGETKYGLNFASVVKKDNYYGVQFHPEKSGEVGEKLFKNFIGM
ncbi:imidazole glycerol phosphate synthase subunit HisH [Patescibacteria group bacterium]|nr:imidazole glycerol phosphate synthase subunit HisH [Patescibacteria group bacterium]